MKFIILTTKPDDFFDLPAVSLSVNTEHIVLMKDISEYSDYMTEVELSNKGVLVVCETIQEILDMITEG